MAIVFIPAQLRHLTDGADRLQVEGSTVSELLDELERFHPGIKSRLCEDDRLSPVLQVSVDNTLVGQNLQSKVDAHSEVHFLPAIGGG